MAALIDRIEGRRVEGHRPWPRAIVREEGWRAIISGVSAGRLTLLGLWGDSGCVHMAVLDEDSGEIAVASFDCPQKQYPSVAAQHPPAIRLERALHDLYGIQAVGLPDTRAWLDLGFWDVRHPLRGQRKAAPTRTPYPFLHPEAVSPHPMSV